MAFASVGTLGTATSKTAGTTVVITTGATAEVGNVIVVETAWDNTATTDGDTTNLSVTDSAGNTYTVVKETTETTGVAADGITVAQFYTVVTTQLGSGGTITVTSDTSRTAKVAAAWEFTKGAGTLTVEQVVTAQGNATDPAAISVASMSSREYLLKWTYGQERDDGGGHITQDADYAATGTATTTAGAVESNVLIGGGYRIATLTGDTVDAASATDNGAHVQILAALYEAGGAVAHNLAAVINGASTVAAALSLTKPLAAVIDGSTAVTAALTVGSAAAPATSGVFNWAPLILYVLRGRLARYIPTSTNTPTTATTRPRMPAASSPTGSSASCARTSSASCPTRPSSRSATPPCASGKPSRTPSTRRRPCARAGATT